MLQIQLNASPILCTGCSCRLTAYQCNLACRAISSSPWVWTFNQQGSSCHCSLVAKLLDWGSPASQIWPADQRLSTTALAIYFQALFLSFCLGKVEREGMTIFFIPIIKLLGLFLLCEPNINREQSDFLEKNSYKTKTHKIQLVSTSMI